MPDHGAELGSDLLSAKHSVYAGREKQPQPAPPGCGLSTSSTSLKPRSIAALTSLKEYADHYRIVMFGKTNFARNIRFARFEIVSTRGVWSFQ